MQLIWNNVQARYSFFSLSSVFIMLIFFCLFSLSSYVKIRESGKDWEIQTIGYKISALILQCRKHQFPTGKNQISSQMAKINGDIWYL